ncbi:MAG: RNA polymerase sigma-70 factor [Tenuifilaceae bacterium]|nr:RNA polymerase sigma-70 factor [Tenuifilaceae bacterium]
MEASDNYIIEQLRNGNEQVFETIFRTYYKRLCNYANTILWDIDESEEIVQNAFLAIWEKHETLNVHTSLKSYLYSAIYNSSLNKIKHNKVRKQYSEAAKHQGEPLFNDASHDLVNRELNGVINQSIESLPQQCRAVFKLSRFENLTYAEIAQQMGLSVKTVENHMIKALKVLREDLKEYLPILILMLLMKS